jgi:hypothetical protein
MYVLIAIAYAGLLTASLALLIPLNLWLLDLLNVPITNAEIPRSGELAFFTRPLGWISPLSYVITGFERAIWATAGFVLIGLIGVRLAGGLISTRTMIRAVVINAVVGMIVLGTLHSGSAGIHQYLFDRLVQPPSGAFLEYPGQ